MSPSKTESDTATEAVSEDDIKAELAWLRRHDASELKRRLLSFGLDRSADWLVQHETVFAKKLVLLLLRRLLIRSERRASALMPLARSFVGNRSGVRFDRLTKADLEACEKSRFLPQVAYYERLIDRRADVDEMIDGIKKYGVDSAATAVANNGLGWGRKLYLNLLMRRSYPESKRTVYARTMVKQPGLLDNDDEPDSWVHGGKVYCHSYDDLTSYVELWDGKTALEPPEDFAYIDRKQWAEWKEYASGRGYWYELEMRQQRAAESRRKKRLKKEAERKRKLDELAADGPAREPTEYEIQECNNYFLGLMFDELRQR